jgi:hypothetical protein
VSATGRGTNRDPKDFYATPFASFSPLLNVLPTDVMFFEPCAGDGRILRWLRDSGRKAIGSDLYPQKGSLIDKTYYDETPTNYLKVDWQHEFVLTNPPFSIAFEMCQHARKYSREFMFLLRLSFLESEARSDWLSANEPAALFVLKKRPSFVMSVTCKSEVPVMGGVRTCKHNWLLPIEAERPKQCPVCQGSDLAISTSDNSGYAWFYWGDRFTGIRHI